MRGGATDDDSPRRSPSARRAKWAGHQIGQVHFIRPKKSMSQIGG
jgi:GTP 3',8-cyclase